MAKGKLTTVLTLAVLCGVMGSLPGCGGGGGGSDDGSGGGGGGGDVSSGSDSTGKQTTCGVLVGNTLRNPVDLSRGELVTLVDVIDSNLVSVARGGETLLVKLHGLGDTLGFNNTAVKELYRDLAQEPIYFFQAGNDCTAVVTGNQTALVGQIMTESGLSFSEAALDRKFAGVIETAGECNEDAVADCYQNITATNEHHNYGAAVACNSTVPASIRYRPSDTDCGGKASLVVSSDFGSVFSIQLRYPDGTDRITDSCEQASCTPLKVQNYIRGDTLTVACFGAPGTANALSDVNHVSIKRESDDHEPPRYCIPDPTQPIN